MKKLLFSATIATLIVSSCVQNDLLNGPGVTTPNDGKIRFAASTGLNAKAAPGNPFNTTGDLQKLGKFTVEGYVEGAGTDFIGSAMEWNAASSSWEYEGGKDVPYWPNTWMDFYAYANWALAPTIDAAQGTITSSVVVAADNVADNTGHRDLLVAITPNATKESRTLLTFKHALTQIVFKAGNTAPLVGGNAKLDVKISGLELLNVHSAGDMTFGKATRKVEWGNQSAITSYAVQGITEYSVAAIDAADVTNYSKFPRIQTSAAPTDNALMLLPQQFDAWTPASRFDPNLGASGASIKVTASLCDPRQVTTDVLLAVTTEAEAKNLQKYVYCGTIVGVNNDTDFAGGAKLVPGVLYIPVDSKENAGLWEAGKRINYIISFGDIDSGSGGAGYDEEGNPILVHIKFRAVVEDWTEVTIPLLTANISANSTALTHQFINGFTNQLLNDVKSASAPKLYAAKLTFKGITSASIGIGADLALANEASQVTFNELIDGKANAFKNAKFLPGSTLSYDLTAVDATNGQAHFAVPTGWVVKSGDLNNNNASLVLEKLAESGYSFVGGVNYIQENLNALELNETGAASVATFNDVIYAKGAVRPASVGTPYHFVFSAESLAKLKGAAVGSTVAIDMTDVDFTDADITTWCPAGWRAEVEQTMGNSVSYGTGEAIQVSVATSEKKILFTKVATSYTVSYHSYAGLKSWLDASPSATDVYYYDNVDFDVVINNATLLTTSTPAIGAKIVLKYPLSSTKVTLSEWDVTLNGAGNVESLIKK